MNIDSKLLESIDPVYGLTLWPEWLPAFAAGKDIENRTWRSPRAVGQWIALHAGAGIGGAMIPLERALRLVYVTTAAAYSAHKETLSVSWRRPVGGSAHEIESLVSSPSPAGFQVSLGLGALEFFRRKIAAVAYVQEISDLTGQPWAFQGQQHWKVGPVLFLERPIPCKGALSLWEMQKAIPANARADLRRQLSEGRFWVPLGAPKAGITPPLEVVPVYSDLYHSPGGKPPQQQEYQCSLF